MDKQTVGQLPDLTQSNNDDEIMVITDSEHNQLKKEKISDFITDLTSTDENNALTKGTDGKMFVTDFGNASNITDGTLPTSVLPEIPLEKIPDIPKDKLPSIETSDLPVSGVTADTYAYPSSVTVNAQGQVTAIEEGSPSGANANTDLSNITDAGKEVIRQNSGAGMPVGSIIEINASSSYVPENCLYADGSTQTKASYSNMYTDWLVGGRIETCTFEEFDQLVAQTGECWKWGLDTETETFRVPKINDIVVRGIADTIPAKGNGMTAGLTDGTNFGGLINELSTLGAKLDKYGSDVGSSWSATANFGEKTIGVTTDPTKSGIVAVTENALKTQTIKHFVVVATGSINQSQMDWSAWASSLAGKANVTDIDGMWTTANYQIFDSVSFTAQEVKTYDLSAYLPNDGNIYEVIFEGKVTTGSKVGDTGYLGISTTLINICCVIGTQTTAARKVIAMSSVPLPVGADRIVKVNNGSALDTATFDLYINAYRKVR